MDNQEELDKARRQQKINDFMKSPSVANFMLGRKKELHAQLKAMLQRDAEKALNRFDEENKELKERGEPPLPEEDSQLSINNGVVDTVFGYKVKAKTNEEKYRQYARAGQGLGH